MSDIPWPEDEQAPDDDPDAAPATPRGQPAGKPEAIEGELVIPWLIEGDGDRRHDAPRYDEETIAEAIRAKVAGVPVSQIAAKLGCSRQTVYRWCEDAGAHQRGGNPEAVLRARGDVVVELNVATYEAWRVVRSYPGTEIALKALDRIGRNLAAKAALLGLNAPIVAQVDVHQVDDRELELREMIAKARSLSEDTIDQVRRKYEADRP